MRFKKEEYGVTVTKKWSDTPFVIMKVTTYFGLFHKVEETGTSFSNWRTACNFRDELNYDERLKRAMTGKS